MSSESNQTLHELTRLHDEFGVDECIINDSIKVKPSSPKVKVTHSSHVKGAVMLGGIYPLKGEDVPLEKHILLLNMVLEIKGSSQGIIVKNEVSNDKFYLDKESSDRSIIPT